MLKGALLSLVGILTGGVYGGTAARGAGAAAPSPAPCATLATEARFGAAGDGLRDDTAALQAALGSGRGVVHLPAGVYRIGSTLKVPSGVTLRGEGAQHTVLKAAPGTVFDAVRPDPACPDERERRTMLTTAGAGTARASVSSRIRVEGVTLDWSHCPAAGRATAPLLIDSSDDVVVRDVTFASCLPDDYPADPYATEAEGRMVPRSHCLAVSKSRRVLLEKIALSTAGYRSLGVAYASRDVTLRDSTVRTANPWRHGVEVHGGVGETDPVKSDLTVDSCYLEASGGRQRDIVCSHGGSLRVRNSTFVAGEAGTADLRWAVKAFAGAKDCVVSGNTFRLAASGHVAAVGAEPGYAPTTNTLVESNLIEVTQASPSDRVAHDLPLLGMPNLEAHENVTIRGNLIAATVPANERWYAIALSGSNVVVSDNVVNLVSAGDHVDTGPHGIRLHGAGPATMRGNIVRGSYWRGFEVGRPAEGRPCVGTLVGNVSTEAVAADYHHPTGEDDPGWVSGLNTFAKETV